jgi:hypothetical protein
MKWLSDFWTQSRTRRITLALIIALLFGAIISAALDKDRRGMVLRGDFPAFYAAAEIVLSGAGSRLYDTDLQKTTQNKYWPSLNGEYYSFAYPPFTALAAAPFATLTPLRAKLLHVALMLLCLWGAAASAARVSNIASLNQLDLFAVFLAFGPVTSGVLGGQNTALSMLLCFSAIELLQQAEGRRDVLAGVLIGLWSFKPQFSLIAIVLLIVCGRQRAALTSVVTIGVLYTVTALIFGAGWPLLWLSAIQRFAEQEIQANHHQMISFAGGAAAAADFFSGNPLSGLYLGQFVSLLLFLPLSWNLWSDRSKLSPVDRSCLLPLLLPATVVFLAPHALFYDLGLCLLPICIMLPRNSGTQKSFLALGLAAVLAICLSRTYYPVQPLFLLSAACFFLAWWKTRAALS